jgi:LmbE family N-acetylglucosaminyl deacetylase
VTRGAAAAFRGADVVLLPGSPLSHPDHAWLVRTITGAPVEARRLGLYAEQPYTLRAGEYPVVPRVFTAELEGQLAFAPVKTAFRDRLAKYRAIRAYASQLQLLALGGRRGLELALHPELVAWVQAAAASRLRPR